jgi:hypothetical protein
MEEDYYDEFGNYIGPELEGEEEEEEEYGAGADSHVVYGKGDQYEDNTVANGIHSEMMEEEDKEDEEGIRQLLIYRESKVLSWKRKKKASSYEIIRYIDSKSNRTA